MIRHLAGLLSALLAALLVQPEAKVSSPLTYEAPKNGYSFQYDPSWSLNPIKVDNRSDGIWIKLNHSASISIQRYTRPYHKAGVGTWKNSQDYLDSLQGELDRINKILESAKSAPIGKILEAQNLPPSAKRYRSIRLGKKKYLITVLVMDRKKDFLTISYEASPKLHEKHWPDFVSFLDSFQSK